MQVLNSSSELIGAQLYDCSFSRCRFYKADYRGATLKHCELDAKVPSASSIGEEVGKNIGAVLEATLSEFKKPVASSLREQILGEISFTVMPKDQNFTDLASQRRCDPQPLYW